MSYCQYCRPHPDHTSDKYSVIRNQKSGFVLDASEYEVKLQHFTGFSSQLWKLEPADGGKFFIVNKGNGKVLDVEGGVCQGNNLIAYEKHGEINQQWHVNSDNTIVCAGKLAVDICDGTCIAGNIIIAWPKHGGENQKFILQYQS